MSNHQHRPRFVRGAVLVAAVAAGIGLATLTTQDPTPPPAGAAWGIADASANRLVQVQDTKPSAPDAGAATPTPKPNVDTEISIGDAGIVVKKRDGKASRKATRADDMEFDSFEEFVEQAPWLAAMVFGVTALVLFTPVLVIALIIWYKVRSNRMRNETMLKLAERGVVPTAEAMAAVAAGSAGAALQNSPSTAPLYQQANQIRKRAAWSDLRKGIIIGGVGLGLSFATMLSHGDANMLGLVLLFVGIGYIVLWYFEGRELPKPGDGRPGPTGGP